MDPRLRARDSLEPRRVAGFATARRGSVREQAVAALGGLVDCVMPLEPVVTAARERVVGAEGRPRKKPVDPRR